MSDHDIDEYATGAIACMVLDLCDDAEVRLTKADFVKLARATARILLVASATDDAMIDVRGGDGFAAENAATIRAIWRNLSARSTEPRN
jgi:hypothetical protein